MCCCSSPAREGGHEHATRTLPCATEEYRKGRPERARGTSSQPSEGQVEIGTELGTTGSVGGSELGICGAAKPVIFQTADSARKWCEWHVNPA